MSSIPGRALVGSAGFSLYAANMPWLSRSATTIVLRPQPSESASARTETAPSGSFITPVASRPSVTFTVAGPRPTLPDAIPYPPR